MARHGRHRGAILVTIVTAALSGHAQTRIDSSGSPPLSGQQPPSTADLAARIDDLLKQCNEQMNITGQFQRVEELAQQALALSRELGDKRRASTAMVFLSAAYGYQGRLTEALDVSQKNLALAREIGDTKVLEDALNTVGSVLGESGRYEESLRYLYECLDVARASGDT